MQFIDPNEYVHSMEKKLSCATPADLLGCDLVKRLLGSTCVFLSSKRREVVKATLEFVKVTIGVLPADELLPHVEELVSLRGRRKSKIGVH